MRALRASFLCRSRRDALLLSLPVALATIFIHSLNAQTAPNPVQAFDATHLTEPADLGGIWLVHAGDDPAYADPGYDDSHWTPFDPHTEVKALFPDNRPEVLWYRQRIQIDPAQTGLAVREQSISHAYEVYVNGDRIIASG